MDKDDIDGCEADFAAAAVSEEEQEYLPLFPNGGVTPDLEAKADFWRDLAKDA